MANRRTARTARTVRRWTAGAAVAVTMAAGLVGPAAAAQAAPECARPGAPVAAMPWAQQVLNPDEVWPFSQGAGVTVAVLSSGVDASHPQLRGRVLGGYDAVRGFGGADSDCNGAGTRVAGLIVARRADGARFTGLAPAARVLPVRVRDDASPDDAPTDPQVLANGISWAVDQGAQVIAVAVDSDKDHPALRTAVRRAVDRGSVVVAASGDHGDDDNPQSYPAGYPEVLAVGAIDQEGQRWGRSQFGPYLDLVAPGVGITTTQRGGGLTEAADGTALACGFVAASVALTLAKRDGVPRSELIQLLTATAVSGADPYQYGHGVVNPYGAINGHLLPDERPVPMPGFTAGLDRSDPDEAASRRTALIGALAALIVVLVVSIVAIMLPRARRRRWRAAVASRPVTPPEPDEPGPPIQLFDEVPAGPVR
ncbi:S8 family serine peptidase [Micromonospora sp. NPDC005367]|uniref:S8 family serine peptidase n=1 Tax=Micromonospora sp. NPDC005367 TaxID=3155590 RepID=UPI0033AB416C